MPMTVMFTGSIPNICTPILKVVAKATSPVSIKKASNQAISKYRLEVGTTKREDRAIKISDKEWEAIQAGAISDNKLKKILNNTDIDSLRQRATPKTTSGVSAAQVARMKAMRNSNYTLDEIAKKLGVSTSVVTKSLKGES